MNQDQKRQLENQLLVMGLPSLHDAALVQVIADMVNSYPIPSERAQFFCDLLNECDRGKRYEMYNALKPYLHFPVPTFDECETRITARAERMVGRKTSADTKPEEQPSERKVELHCFGCDKMREFSGTTTADALLQAKKKGWGRGPVPGFEYCPDCRMQAMLHPSIGASLTRRIH